MQMRAFLPRFKGHLVQNLGHFARAGGGAMAPLAPPTGSAPGHSYLTSWHFHHSYLTSWHPLHSYLTSTIATWRHDTLSIGTWRHVTLSIGTWHHVTLSLATWRHDTLSIACSVESIMPGGIVKYHVLIVFMNDDALQLLSSGLSCLLEWLPW